MGVEDSDEEELEHKVFGWTDICNERACALNQKSKLNHSFVSAVDSEVDDRIGSAAERAQVWLRGSGQSLEVGGGERDVNMYSSFDARARVWPVDGRTDLNTGFNDASGHARLKVG